MKYHWRLAQKQRKLVIYQTGVAGGDHSWKYDNRGFEDEDINMLRFLLQELTNTPKGIGFHKIMEIQKHLGDAVWNKLGER